LSSNRESHTLQGWECQVPDQPYPYEKLTGREFLRFVVEMYGLDRRMAAFRLAELIETFEVADYIDELCENYSQGMKQRVVFASALIHDPKVLIVDEPLVGLDPRSARIVKDLFVAEARSGVAVLMSTHLLSIAEELADTIGIVDHGRLLAHGSLAELRERVQSRGPLEDLFLKLTDLGLQPAEASPLQWGRRKRSSRASARPPRSLKMIDILSTHASSC
jgi:ABC-2 type transport system ATP-binding protein